MLLWTSAWKSQRTGNTSSPSVALCKYGRAQGAGYHTKHGMGLISSNLRETPEAGTNVQMCRRARAVGGLPQATDPSRSPAGIRAEACDLRARVLHC